MAYRICKGYRVMWDKLGNNTDKKLHEWDRIWLRGGLPGKEDAKRIQGFTNQWGIYNKYPSFIDNEDITSIFGMLSYSELGTHFFHLLCGGSPLYRPSTSVFVVKYTDSGNDARDPSSGALLIPSKLSGPVQKVPSVAPFLAPIF
ncbi:hypothetical protein B0H14DRAFT_2590646 [Mycena olivaceomarginata]|nr:hypothetical protein B0H14DRAFT_2590646 [Mycena olivaceomarginata]